MKKNINPLAGIIAATLCVVVWAISAQCAITPTPFIANNPIGGAPIGWAFAGNKFVGSILDSGSGQNLLYSTNLTGGNIQPFGGTVTLAVNYGLEHYVSSSIGLGGFPVGDVYVASGNNIQHITNAGVADPGLFVNGSTGGINGLVRGITFDSVGTFNHDMIVTTHNGFVYTVDSAGNATQIASTGEDTEGLDVAPLGGNWPGMNGWLFVASEGSGSIRAIKPNTFAMTTVATVPSAEELDFVPLNLGASGSPLEGLYGGNYNTNVVMAGASQFAGLQGDIIVTGETTHSIYDVNAINGVTVDGAFPNQPEDGLFVTTSILQNDNLPEPASFTLLGAVSLMALRRPRRSASL
ncbi:MAG: hypothetical protein M3O30_06210 [Planctomycetota bacterium]|nr:hypothetical protein [Planctomycetota bacterium]